MAKRGKYASRQAEGQRKMADAPASKKKLVAGLIIALVAGPLIFYFAFFGSEFRAPAVAPLEYQTGYYEVTLYDVLNGEYLTSNTIVQINASNYAILRNDLATNMLYYCSSASYLFINISGYYPLTVALWASGGTNPATYQNNTILIQKRANPEDISFGLVRWYNHTDEAWIYSNRLPSFDGRYTFHLQIDIDYPSRNVSLFGGQSWIPSTVLESGSLANQLNLTWITNWLGFDCDEITGYGFRYLTGGTGEWPFQEIYTIPSILNCTVIPSVWYTLDFYIDGTFKNLQSIQLFEGLVNNYVSPVGVITR